MFLTTGFQTVEIQLHLLYNFKNNISIFRTTHIPLIKQIDTNWLVRGATNTYRGRKMSNIFSRPQSATDYGAADLRFN